MGSRALRHWLTHPLRDRPSPTRHDAIAALLARAAAQALREALRHLSDVERIVARIALRQVRPRELSGLRETLRAARAARRVPLRRGTARHVAQAPR